MTTPKNSQRFHEGDGGCDAAWCHGMSCRRECARAGGVRKFVDLGDFPAEPVDGRA